MDHIETRIAEADTPDKVWDLVDSLVNDLSLEPEVALGLLAHYAAVQRMNRVSA